MIYELYRHDASDRALGCRCLRHMRTVETKRAAIRYAMEHGWVVHAHVTPHRPAPLVLLKI